MYIYDRAREWKRKRDEEEQKRIEKNGDIFTRARKWAVKNGRIDLEEIYNDISGWTQNWLKNSDSFNNEYNSVFANENQEYVSDHAQRYTDAQAKNKQYYDEGQAILDYLSDYEEFFSKDAVTSIRDAITAGNEENSKILDAYKNASLEHSKYDNEYAIVTAIESKDYDAAEQMLKDRADKLVSKYDGDYYGLINSEEYKELLGFEDAIKQKREYAEYKPFWDAIDAGDLESAETFLTEKSTGKRVTEREIDWFGTAANIINNAVYDMQQGVQYAYRDADKGYADETLQTYWDILNGEKEKKAYADNNAGYLGLMENEDFAEKSKFVSTKQGDREIDWLATIGTNLANSILGAQQGSQTVYKEGQGYEDIIYDIINGNAEAKNYYDIQSLNDHGALAVASGIASSDYLTEMTDDEKKIFNYIYATEGKEKAYEYFSHLEKNYLNSRNRETIEKNWATFADEHPVIASLGTVALAPARGFSFLAQGADLLGDGEIDKDARYNALLYGSNATKSTVSQNIEKSGKWGEVGSFAYDVGMSMGEFLISTAVSGGNSIFAGLIMGANAAAETTLSGLDRGLDSTRAFITGTAAGLAEFFTEKMGVDNLLDKALLSKSKFNYVMKNMLSEGIEEGATDIINWAVDDLYDLISGQDKSEWKTAVAEYIDQGYSESEAFGKVLGDRLIQLGTDVAAGAASGGIMGGAGAGMQAISEYREAKTKSASRVVRTDADITLGTKIADFISSVINMQDRSKISKRKLNLGGITKAHQTTVDSVMKTVDSDFSSEGYELWMDGTSAEHIVKRHGEKGEADNSMATREAQELIALTVNDPDAAILIKDEAGNLKLSNRYFNADGSKAPQIRLERVLDDGTVYVSECIPDSVNKRIYITSAYVKKGSTDQLLNMDPEGSPQPTPEASFDGSATNSSISQDGTNVNSKISTELMQYAELAGMGENGVQLMQEVYDGKMSPEKFFEAYNAIYAAGKRGGEVRGRYVSLLGENVAAMARNAGEMDALRASGKDAKNTPHPSATPTPSPKGEGLGAKAAELLSTAKIETLDTNRSYYKLDDLGIPKEEQQAWIDAGIAKERPIRGQTVVTVNTTVLKDEVSRRENSSAKGLSNDTNSGTIESTDDAIWRYKSSESYKINEAIRSGRELTAEESAFIKELDRDLEKTPKYSGVTYRNISFDMQGQEAFDAFVAEHAIGSVKTYDAYTSTSKEKDGYTVEGDLLVHIEIHGENGCDISNGYGLEIEQEVLFKRNTDFYVSSVSSDGKTANIVLEEVAYGESEISRSLKGNNTAQQRYDSENIQSEVQRMQASGQVDVQEVSERNTKGDSSQRSGLQGVRGEVSTDAAPDVQQAKGGSSEWSTERIEGGKVEKARPVSEIIEQIRHDFGINITKGHVRGKGVLGQYNRRNHGIRTKIANDLPTVAHELGHALDQRYGLTQNGKLSKDMRSELIAALGDLKDSYKQDLWVSEGLAEYMRRFLQNRDDAARTYPEFTKYFLNSLSKADRVLIDTFADEINAYYALDGDTATSSIRLREEGVPDARTPLEKARDMGDGVYQAWVDANHGIRLFDEATGANTYKLATNAAYSDAIAGQIITGDLTDANGQYVAPGLKAALEGVNIGDKRIYREFGEYLVLRHGPERLNEGMMIFADPRKNTASFMAKRQAELEAAHPEFKEAADRLYTFQKQFLKTWAVDTRLLPSEVAEEWAKRWSFYVPLNRAVGKAGTVGAKRGYANQNSTIKKAIGSGLDIVHPVDNIINNIVKMVNAGVRNNVMLEITAQARAVGADATFLEEVPTPMKKKTADLTGVKAKLHDAFGAAGIGELLAEIEGESETQARASGQASADIRIDMDDAERYEILKDKSIQPQKIEVDPKFDIDFEYLEKNIKSEIEKPLIKKLRELGYLKRYKTDAIEIDFEFTGGGLRKSLNSQATAYGGSFADLAKVVLNLQKLLDNSVLIEIHSDKGAGTDLENKQLVQTFVMMSAFAEGNSIVPVQFEVKQFVDNANRLYLAVALTKIETGVVGNTTLDKNQASTYLLPVSSISIADLFSKINIEDENFFKYIPDGFLNEKQIDAKKRALAKDEAKYGKKTRASSLLATHGLQLPARPSPASSSTSIPQTNENVNKKISTNPESKKTDAWSKVDEIIESAIDDVLVQYGQGKAHGDVVTVLREGKQEFWKINDALLLESLTNLSQKKMNGIMEAYAVVSRFMTSNITGNNIIWSIFSNFPRDMMTFFTYSKQKNPLKSFPAMGEAYLNKVTGGNAETKNLPYIKEYYALGGGQTSAYTADVDLAKRARKKLKHSTKLQSAAYYANPLNVLSFVSETVESGPRIATYIMMREKGMSPQEAFYESQDITVNFKRGGRLSREFNKAVPFFNASVQGLDKFKRWITCADVPKAQRAKAIVGRVTMYVAVSAALGALIYALNNGDDEDEENYRLLSNYTKNTYWNIPLGDGKYFAIPKPREIAVLSTFIETTCEYFGGNDYAYEGFGEYATDNFLPPFLSDFVTDGMDGAIGSLGIIGVASDLKANKDFLGRPIESTSLSGYESQDRYTRRTSQIAYWLGQAAAELGLDWSPVQIDYFFSQVLGGYWKVQKALFPVGSENVDWTLGVQNTYVKDNQYSNDIVNWMYDKATSSAQAAKSHPEDTDIAIEAKLDGDMKSFYSRYYALTKNQKEDAAARRAKRVVLDMIVEYRKASANGDRSEVQKVVYGLIDRCHDTSLLPSVMQSKVKDGEGAEYSLRDYQYVEYQTTYNALYWGYVEDNLGGAETDAEMIAIIKKAQTIAKERATEKALQSVGAGSSGYFDKYPGIDDSDLITFQSQMDIETDKDGGLSQEELIGILEGMVADGLSKEDAYTLFKSRYPTSDKNNPWRWYAP